MNGKLSRLVLAAGPVVILAAGAGTVLAASTAMVLAAGPIVGSAAPGAAFPSAAPPAPSAADAAGAAAPGRAAQTAQELYEQAYFREQGRGDLEGAIALYRRIVEEHPQDRQVVARALLRIGICYERLGFTGAEEAYRRILDEFADHPEIARVARQRLDNLRATRSEVRVLSTGSTLREVRLPGGRVIGDPLATLSPDGTRIALRDELAEQLVVYDVESGRIRPLVPGLEFLYNRWSPDGRRLAYDQSVAGLREIGVVDTVTGEHWTVYRGPAVTVVDWMPGGDAVAYYGREPGGDDRFGLGVVSAPAPAAPSRWFPLAGENHRISPDGRFVAFATGGDASEIHVVPFGEPDDVRVVPASRAGADRNPVWCPHGEHIGFLSDRSAAWDFWVVGLRDGVPVGEPARVRNDVGEGARLQDWLSDDRITYTHDTSLRNIWVATVDPDTGEPLGSPYRVGPVGGRNSQLEFSPQGDRVVFRAAGLDRRGDIAVVRLDGSQEEVHPVPENAQNPTWFPDGERILYASWDDDNPGDILLHEYDLGSRSRRLWARLEGMDRTVWPDVSPDGGLVALDVYFRESDESGIYLHDGERMRHVPGTSGNTRAPVWSPDGSWIAYGAADEGGGFSIRLARPDGSEHRVVVRVPADEWLNNSTWLPDGRRLAYLHSRPESEDPSERDWNVWIVDIDGTKKRRIGDLGRAPWMIDWSPTGRHVAMAAIEGTTQFWIMESLWRGDHATAMDSR